MFRYPHVDASVLLKLLLGLLIRDMFVQLTTVCLCSFVLGGWLAGWLVRGDMFVAGRAGARKREGSGEMRGGRGGTI